MGFYIRKSLRAGPFRFNLSKSGVGVSTGVPGFRVGSGPRGNYVHIGTHGLYYRATLNAPATTAGGSSIARNELPPAPASLRVIGSADAVPMEDVTGASVHILEPTAGGDLVQQLNEAVARVRLAPVAAIALFIAGCFLMPWGLILWAAAVPLVWFLALRDTARKSVVLFYDVNDAQAQWYQRIVDATTAVSSARAVWRVIQQGQTIGPYQRKVNAGAGALVNRISARVHLAGPKVLVSNVSVPTIEAGNSSIHFLPDRMLVRDAKQYTDVNYDLLEVVASTTRFIESGPVPADAARVGTTWQYVNKGGGPDRRFTNNRQLPIMQYDEISLTTPQGLRWEIQASLVPALQQIATVVKQHPPAKLVIEKPQGQTSES